MLDRLIDLAVHRRTATLLFTLALFAGGLYTYFNLPIEAYPDVTNLQVNIITLFPGQASEEVERQVTIPLERGLSALPKAIDLRSVSVFGLSYIIVTFDDEVDMYFARQVVTERLRQVDLPDGVVSVLGPQITPLGEVYQFTVDGGGKSPTELRTLLDWTIVPFLKQVPGVADIVAQGGFRKEIHILVGPDRLKAHGITLTTVYEALSRSNANIGAGHIRHGQEQYIVRGLGLLRSPDDIKEIVLTAEKGTPVRIIIPASLLTAFAGLYLIKVPANLISMGAIDFGIIVDGAVILIENIYRRLGERRPDPHRVPIVIAQAAKEVAVPTLFSLIIIMAALIPIYAFQRVEGRIFKPMAYTYAFALTGALLFSFTAVLAMAALLIKRAPHGELESWFMVAARRVIEPLVAHALRLRKVVLIGLVALLLASGFLLTRLGTEFLPVLNEGDLHVYVEMPNSIALPEGQIG